MDTKTDAVDMDIASLEGFEDGELEEPAAASVAANSLKIRENFNLNSEKMDVGVADDMNEKKFRVQRVKMKTACRHLLIYEHLYNMTEDSRVSHRSMKEERCMQNSPTPNDENHPIEDKTDNRKLEICQLYLKDSCFKSHTCLYMHADFPCKYFYLGLECKNAKPCKYLHGKALNEDMKTALIRHVMFAPRAILRNFKRMSLKKLKSMLEPRNAQLLMEESGGGIQTFEENGVDFYNRITNEETLGKRSQNENDKNPLLLESRLNQNLKHFPEVFTETQLRALSELGITCLQQISNLTLAKLSEIGLSVLQMNELQQKLERADNTRLRNRKHFVSAENYLKVNDSDFKMAPPVEEKMRELNFHDSDEEGNLYLETDVFCSESDLEEILKPLDELWPSDFLDDECKMRSDESACSESENKVKQSPLCTKDYQRAKKDSGVSHETGASPEIELTSSQSSTLVSYEGDLHMKMPFVPLTNLIPASEIQASISSHAPIKYKLIQILIPKIQKHIDLNTALSYNKLLDPRLRYLQLPKNHFLEENQSSNAATKYIDKSPTSSNTSTLFRSPSSDPRKRKANEVPNFQTIFNGYLQKSRWYQEQNSHIKIETNQLLAQLSHELSRFHLNPNANAYFELRNLELPDNVDEVLFKLGIRIDEHGNVCSSATESKPSSEGGSSGIPSLLTLNVSDATVNFHGYSSSGNIPPFLPGNLLPPPPPWLDMPKPGLLGFAPGIQYPPPFPVHPANPDFIRFQREVAGRHQHWQNFPPGPPFYHRPIAPPPFVPPYDARRRIIERRNDRQNRGGPLVGRGSSKRFRRF